MKWTKNRLAVMLAANLVGCGESPSTTSEVERWNGDPLNIVTLRAMKVQLSDNNWKCLIEEGDSLRYNYQGGSTTWVYNLSGVTGTSSDSMFVKKDSTGNTSQWQFVQRFNYPGLYWFAVPFFNGGYGYGWNSIRLDSLDAAGLSWWTLSDPAGSSGPYGQSAFKTDGTGSIRFENYNTSPFCP
jgi:hypothetical protein